MSVLDLPTPRVFAPLLKPARYKGAHGGRGGAKSWFYADSAIEWCLCRPGSRVVCIREVQKTLKESVKLLIEDRLRHHNLLGQFRIQGDRIVTPGNGVILFQGMQDHTAESIKSLEGFDVAYVEEAQTITQRSLELLRPTIRKASSELWFAWNPRHALDPVDVLFRGPAGPPPESVVIRSLWSDNPFFPSELELERQYDERVNPVRYGHVWEGEYEPQAVGAIFTRQNIHENRRAEAPPMGRIVIGVDPPASSGENAAEAGIAAAGIGTDGRGYLLDDASEKGKPKEWAERAVALYDFHEADAIVAEVNNGGDMVESTIHAVRPSIRVIKVWASRGKHIRAEPISALYGLNRISHVGAFPKLEGQLCQFTDEGYEGDGSPDRAEAAIWAFTNLFPKMIRRQRPKDKPLPKRANSRYSVHRRRA